MMKKAPLCLIIAGILCGCSSGQEQSSVQKNVVVTESRQMDYETALDYLGIVKAQETRNYAFLSGGRIEKIYVKEGEWIAAGAPLAKLDTVDAEINVNTARINAESLRVSVETSQSALDASAVLHREGYISDKEWESLSSSHTTLKGNYEMALESLKQAERSLEESTLYAREDGYVMEVPYVEGEIISSGSPVVIMKSSGKVVSIGVSAYDIGNVSLSSTVKINGDTEASIDQIGQYPDENIRSYPVDIIFDSDQYVIGDVVEVEILTGTATACFIPVESVFNNDGLDYVYTVDSDGIVSRKQVSLLYMDEDMVGVDGLESGTLVVNDGIKSIRENDVVTAVYTEQ